MFKINIRKKKVILLSAVLWSSLGLAAFAADVTEVGRNSAVKGDIKILSEEEKIARQALVKEPVFLGDKVTSQIGSSLQVLLRDNSTFTVGPQCDMVIDKFVYDPDKNNNTLSAKVKKGMFRFTSGKVSKTNPKQVNVTTPTATMGIRGTMVEVLVGPEAFLCAKKEGLLSNDVFMDHAGATLVILRGPGSNTTSLNRQGEVIIESAGHEVTLTESGTGVLVSNANQKPSEPFIVSDTLFNYFNRSLRTRPTQTGNFSPFEIDEAWFTPKPRPVIEEAELFTPLDTIEDTDWPSSPIDDIGDDLEDNFVEEVGGDFGDDLGDNFVEEVGDEIGGDFGDDLVEGDTGLRGNDF